MLHIDVDGLRMIVAVAFLSLASMLMPADANQTKPVRASIRTALDALS